MYKQQDDEDEEATARYIHSMGVHNRNYSLSYIRQASSEIDELVTDLKADKSPTATRVLWVVSRIVFRNENVRTVAELRQHVLENYSSIAETPLIGPKSMSALMRLLGLAEAPCKCFADAADRASDPAHQTGPTLRSG